MPHIPTASSPNDGSRRRAERLGSATKHAEATRTIVVALTGATGFIGRAFCAALVRQGMRVRVLMRRPEARVEAFVRLPGFPSAVSVVQGSLEDEASLAEFVDGSEVVVHLAGLVSARRPGEFHRVNVEGTIRLLAAMRAAPRPARILFVSSLAARAPSLSAYAASKCAAEAAVAQAGLEVCTVRPPAVYGPGDRATLPLFRQLARGILIAPRVPRARFSLLYVNDLAELLCRLVERPHFTGELLEPDDGRDGGYGWADIAAIAQAELGRPVRCVRIPRRVGWSAALVGEAIATLSGRPPRLSRGKLGELWYPDWVCEKAAGAALPAWTPRTGFAEGFASTLAWYRRHGWL